jgi:hypothetical protein
MNPLSALAVPVPVVDKLTKFPCRVAELPVMSVGFFVRITAGFNKSSILQLAKSVIEAKNRTRYFFILIEL